MAEHKKFDMELFLSICEKYGVSKEKITTTKGGITFSPEGDIIFLSEFCNYHIDDKDKLVICGCTQKPIASIFSWLIEQTPKYKYCPYCGKEIKFLNE